METGREVTDRKCLAMAMSFRGRERRKCPHSLSYWCLKMVHRLWVKPCQLQSWHLNNDACFGLYDAQLFKNQRYSWKWRWRGRKSVMQKWKEMSETVGEVTFTFNDVVNGKFWPWEEPGERDPRTGEKVKDFTSRGNRAFAFKWENEKEREKRQRRKEDRRKKTKTSHLEAEEEEDEGFSLHERTSFSQFKHGKKIRMKI